MSELVVEMDGDARWVPLAVGDDVDTASVATARDVLRIRGHEAPEPELVEHVAALLAGLGRRAQDDVDEDMPLVSAFALMPEENPTPVAVATLRAAQFERSVEEAVETLIAPADSRYGAPTVEEVVTPGGPAVRVVQRLVDEESRVSAWLAYVWPIPDTGYLLLLSVTFVDLVDAGRWADDFDDLAQLVRASVEHS